MAFNIAQNRSPNPSRLSARKNFGAAYDMQFPTMNNRVEFATSANIMALFRHSFSQGQNLRLVKLYQGAIARRKVAAQLPQFEN